MPGCAHEQGSMDPSGEECFLTPTFLGLPGPPWQPWPALGRREMGARRTSRRRKGDQEQLQWWQGEKPRGKMPALLRVLSPRHPSDGPAAGGERAGDEVLPTPPFLGRCVPAHSPLLSWVQQPPTPVTTPANKTPSNWPLSLRAWTTAPQTRLQKSPTHLKED